MRMRRLALLFMAATLGSACLGACSSDDDPTSSEEGSTSGVYRGVLTGGKETGVLDVTITNGASSGTRTLANGTTWPVTATLKLLGQTVTLTGTFDPTTGSFLLVGGGYTLSGTASGGNITGTYTGPNGSGSFVLLPASQGAVSVFCGAFEGDDKGTWNLTAVRGGAAVGAWASTQGKNGTFKGTWGTNNALSLTGDPVSAQGTLDDAAGNGTWTSASSKGTWSTGNCVGLGTPDAGPIPPTDAGGSDAAKEDGATTSETGTDAQANDAGLDDGSVQDATTDADTEAGANDAGTDATASDAGTDATASDAGTDATVNDGGTDATASDGATEAGNDAAPNDAAVDASADAAADAAADAGADAAADAGLGYTEVLTEANMLNLATDGASVFIGYGKGAGIKKLAINAAPNTTPTTVVTTAHTIAMTVANNTVYWIDNSGKLKSAPANQTSAGTELANASNITGSGWLTVSNGYVYWVEVNGTASIMKVPTTGGTPIALVSGLATISSLAVVEDYGYAYYGTGTELRRVALAGDAGSSELVRSANARSVQYTSGFLFWTEGTDLWQRFLGGTTDTNVVNLPNLADAKVWSDFVYFKQGTGALRRENSFGGSNPQSIASDTQTNEWIVASPYVYWRTNDAGHLRRADY